MQRLDSPIVKSQLEAKDCDLVYRPTSSSDSDYISKKKKNRQEAAIKFKKKKLVKQKFKFFKSKAKHIESSSEDEGACSPIVSGKRKYISPEQLRGRRENNSHVLEELAAHQNSLTSSLKNGEEDVKAVKSIAGLSELCKENNPSSSKVTANVSKVHGSDFHNSTLTATNDYGNVDEDWNVSAIQRKATVTSVSDVESFYGKEIANSQAQKVNFDASPRTAPRTYQKRLPSGGLRYPRKIQVRPSATAVAAAPTTKDPYEFSNEEKKSEEEEEMPKEHEIIEILDDDSSHETRSKTRENKGGEDTEALLVHKHITLTANDYKTLEEGEFLNDTLIEFYLTYLKENILNKEDRDKVYVFSTYFYGRLTKVSNKHEPFEKDKGLTEAHRQYKRVERWTKNVDLFEKDMVIFPICEESHWLLVIAIKPGLIKYPPKSEERQLKGEPFLILLDSMGGGKDKLVHKIRQYLTEEWKNKKGGEETFGKRDVRLVSPSKPEQQNFTDCGIYLLHYVEKMFASVAQFYWLKLPDLTEWFQLDEIMKKRYELAKFIQKLSKEQKGMEVKFPQIRLNKEGGKKSKRKNPRLNYDENYAYFDDDMKSLADAAHRKSRRLRNKPKSSPERHNPRPQRRQDPSTASSSSHQQYYAASDPEDTLQSLNQKLSGKYKIPKRAEGGLRPDQIEAALDAPSPATSPSSHQEEAVIQSKTGEKVTPGRVPENERPGKDDPQSDASEKRFIDYLREKDEMRNHSRRRESYDSSKYERSPSPRKLSTESSSATKRPPSTDSKRSQSPKKLESAQKLVDSILASPNSSHRSTKTERDEPISKLKKRKNDKVSVSRLKDEWTDDGSDSSQTQPSSRKAKVEKSYKNAPRSPSPLFYSKLASVPTPAVIVTPAASQLTTPRSLKPAAAVAPQVPALSKLIGKRNNFLHAMKYKTTPGSTAAVVGSSSSKTQKSSNHFRGNSAGKQFTSSPLPPSAFFSSKGKSSSRVMPPPSKAQSLHPSSAGNPDNQTDKVRLFSARSTSEATNSDSSYMDIDR